MRGKVDHIDVVSGTNKVVLLTLEYNADLTVADIKKIIEERFGLNIHQQILFLTHFKDDLLNERNKYFIWYKTKNYNSIFLAMAKTDKDDQLAESRCMELGVSVIECANVFFMNNELYEKIYFKEGSTAINYKKEFCNQHNIPEARIFVKKRRGMINLGGTTYLQSLFFHKIDGSFTVRREIDLYIAFQHSLEADVKLDASFNKVVLKTLTGGETVVSLVPENFKPNHLFEEVEISIKRLKRQKKIKCIVEDLVTYISDVLGIPPDNQEIIFKGKFQSREKHLLDLYIDQGEFTQDGSLVMSLVVKAPKQVEITVKFCDGFDSTHKHQQTYVLLETDTISDVKRLASGNTGVEKERIEVYRANPTWYNPGSYKRFKGDEFIWKENCHHFLVKRTINIRVYKNNELICEESCHSTFEKIYFWKACEEERLQNLVGPGKRCFLRIRPNSSFPEGKIPSWSKIYKLSLQKHTLKDDIIFDVVETIGCNLF